MIWTKYIELCRAPSDINEHLYTLNRYARQCRHVTELGCRSGVSTWALLAALPVTLISIDIEPCPVSKLMAEAKKVGVDFRFIQTDDLAIQLEPTELLFIDTLHTYTQLSQELVLHAPATSRFIIMHDTAVFGFADYLGNGELRTEGRAGLQPAIDDFLAKSTMWKVAEVFSNNNGLTVLARV